MENPIKMDDLGVPLFPETPISIYSNSGQIVDLDGLEARSNLPKRIVIRYPHLIYFPTKNEERFGTPGVAGENPHHFPWR